MRHLIVAARPNPTDFTVAMEHPIFPLFPRRLINLADMIKCIGSDIIPLLEELEQYEDGLTHCTRSLEAWETGLKAVQNSLKCLLKKATLLELSEAVGRCSLFLENLENALIKLPLQINGRSLSLDRFTPEEISREIKGITHTINKELKQRTFAFIPRSSVTFFEQENLFGKPVNNAFPSAVPEIKEAGNCLAADLHTAAVFHLMRTAEHGLRALARHLKVRTHSPIEFADWGQVIPAIALKIDSLPSGRSAKKAEALAFYRLMLTDAEMLKDVWRNAVMHTRGRYNETEALGVFNRVKEFMQNLSKRVSEVKK